MYFPYFIHPWWQMSYHNRVLTLHPYFYVHRITIDLKLRFQLECFCSSLHLQIMFWDPHTQFSWHNIQTSWWLWLDNGSNTWNKNILKKDYTFLLTIIFSIQILCLAKTCHAKMTILKLSHYYVDGPAIVIMHKLITNALPILSYK